jgi:hypothetical protein
VAISERINTKVGAECKLLSEKFRSEKDPAKRLKLQYKIIEKAATVTMEEVYRLSPRNFGLYVKEQSKPSAEQYKKFEQDYLVQGIMHGGLIASDLPLIVTEQRILNRTFESFAPKVTGGYKRAMERTLLLMTLRYGQLALQMGS